MGQSKKLSMEELIEEMGEKRVTSYAQEFFKIRGLYEKQYFVDEFNNYLKFCKEKSKNSITNISKMSFRFYLKGLDYSKILKQIEEVNKVNDWADYFEGNDN